MSSSSSGLTRRRGNPGSNVSFHNSDADLTMSSPTNNHQTSLSLSSTTAAITTSPSPSSSSSSKHLPPNRSHSTLSTSAGSTRATSAQSVLPDGTRVAWDCEEILLGDDTDIVPINDPNPVPRLTLMEQVLLLGIKDKQGYLSFWNDSLSYVLRGTILIELALRGRIAMVPTPDRRRFPLTERPIHVIDNRPTGETLLDETLRLIRQTQDGTFVSSISQAPVTGCDYTVGSTSTKTVSSTSFTPDLTSSVTSWLGFNNGNNNSTEPNGLSSSRGECWGVSTWMDLLSGETWNIKRVSYQLRQVRERLAKGLVDKGILRTERKSFIIFDMATHPVADKLAKEQVLRQVYTIISTPLKSTGWPPNTSLRDMTLVASTQAGNVLENVIVCMPSLGERELAWARADEIMMAFSRWPLDNNSQSSSLQQPSSLSQPNGNNDKSSDLFDKLHIPTCKVMGLDHLEVVAAVLSIFSRMDTLL